MSGPQDSDEFLFVSYAREDSEFVLFLVQELRRAGLSVWLDQLDIPAGERWDRSIGHALKSSRHMLLVLSPESVDSVNVQDEVSYALDEGMRVTPIMHRMCDVPFRLRRLQFIDFTADDDTDSIARLVRELRARIATGPGPQRAPGVGAGGERVPSGVAAASGRRRLLVPASTGVGLVLVLALLWAWLGPRTESPGSAGAGVGDALETGDEVVDEPATHGLVVVEPATPEPAPVALALRSATAREVSRDHEGFLARIEARIEGATAETLVAGEYKTGITPWQPVTLSAAGGALWTAEVRVPKTSSVGRFKWYVGAGTSGAPATQSKGSREAPNAFSISPVFPEAPLEEAGSIWQRSIALCVQGLSDQPGTRQAFEGDLQERIELPTAPCGDESSRWRLTASLSAVSAASSWEGWHACEVRASLVLLDRSNEASRTRAVTSDMQSYKDTAAAVCRKQAGSTSREAAEFVDEAAR